MATHHTPKLPRHTVAATLLALAALLATGPLAAQADGARGRLAELQLIDRDSGAALPVYRHQGEWWVAGQPGARYAVQVRNSTGDRLLAVMSVDGVNIVSGETAAWHQTGYVFGPWRRHAITGWRKSDAEVAAFHFTALPDSYAARTGRPQNVGVIGVALFRERRPPPPPPVVPMAPESRREMPSAGEAASVSPAPAPAAAPSTAEAGNHAGARADAESARARSMAPAPAAPRLGTGHGERETAWVSHTAFERRSARPDEVITLRYDSWANLVARGIVPAHDEVQGAVRAFPRSPGYVPDPPR